MGFRTNNNKGVYPDGYIYSYYSPTVEKSTVESSLIAGTSRQIRSPLRVERQSQGWKSPE